MDRTPKQIQNYLDEMLYKFDLPSQYYGDEPNAYCKPWDASEVRWLIAASWPYEQAAGNQSIPAVYKQINDSHGLADRWYLPNTPRDMRMFEAADIPMFGIESKRQARDFDIVATSISYPVLIISFVKQLLMSGIPADRRKRQEAPESHPMVIIGGQAYGAPGPLEPIADAIWCGEVEEEIGNPGIQTVTERIADFKRAGLWQTQRSECYYELAREFPFLVFPEHTSIHYGYEDRSHVGLAEPSLQVQSYEIEREGLRAPFVKRFVKDLDAIEPLTNPPLLFADPGMGVGELEVGRGCPAWCSFCALTYRQKPYRQRSVPYMVDFAQQVKDNSGATQLLPFMPDFPMHTQRRGLIAALLENVSDEVDGGAMRVDDFIADGEYILLQVQGGMDAVTLGVEGNSQRMRDFVGKGCADEDIREAVTRGIGAGIAKFKFFMISNMPGEDEGDVFRILALAKDLADIRERMGKPNVQFQFSWTPLLIEANTPFQWFAPSTNTRALTDVWEEFRDINIQFKIGGKAETNKASFFQLCQRSHRLAGEAILAVCEAIAANPGGACWGGVPRKKIRGYEIEGAPGQDVNTEQALDHELRKRGMLNGFGDCFDERFKNDLFGWEYIDQGINPELLWVTYVKMREFLEWTDSHTYDQHFGPDYQGNEWLERCDTKCYGKTCGTCDAVDLKIRRSYIIAAESEDTRELAEVIPVDERSRAVKVRARIWKDESKRFVTNDHWRYHLRRAAYLALNDLEVTDFTITKRSIRFASDGLEYRDWTSGVDYVEFAFTRAIGRGRIRAVLEAMNRHMQGMTISETAWTMQPPNSTALRRDVDLSLWEIPIREEPGSVVRAMQEWEEASYIKMILQREQTFFESGHTEVNAKDYCDDLWLVRDGTDLVLKLMIRGKASPYAVYAALMGKSSWIEAAAFPARRLESFLEWDVEQSDFFRPNSVVSGVPIPVNPLDEAYHPEMTPRELDEHHGRLVSDVAWK
jgi:radical SAM superfamily enzyme YgiQ (UPF0313 family)